MLGWLEGTVLARDEGRILLRIGPVGLWVYVPRTLWEQAREGEALRLYTHLVVRQDALTLYGFARKEEVQAFTLLLQVNGVGPRLALGMLSFITPEALRQAVLEERPELLQRLPGIGRKTARRIILTLQEKWKGEETVPTPPGDAINAEVFEALIALGYSLVEAQRALQQLPPDAPASVEERLRLALQHLAD